MRLNDYARRPAHIKWLLDSDPAIRWHVMTDLTGEAPDAIAAERSRVTSEGWGARLLALQSPAGNWGGPKWDLITLYSLVVLKDLGLDPAGKEARKMIDRVDKRLVFKWLNDRPSLHGETEPCINGRILGIGSYFKEPNDALANQLLTEQLEDGGWNCKAWPFLPRGFGGHHTGVRGTPYRIPALWLSRATERDSMLARPPSKSHLRAPEALDFESHAPCSPPTTMRKPNG
jgi:hypothetical protein